MKKIGIAILMITALGIVAFFTLRHKEDALKRRTPQVQVAVLQADKLRYVGLVLDHERRRLCRVQNLNVF